MAFSSGASPKPNQFTDTEASGVEAGLRQASQRDTINKKFVARNLRPYRSLRQFSSVKGLKKLRGKNMAQLENIAARAVLKKAKVKSKPLNTKINRKRFKPRKIQAGRRALRAIGSDSFRPGSTKGITNKSVRRAANHLRQLRRNRAVNRTRVGSVKAYDIYKGYRRR